MQSNTFSAVSYSRSVSTNLGPKGPCHEAALTCTPVHTSSALLQSSLCSSLCFAGGQPLGSLCCAGAGLTISGRADGWFGGQRRAFTSAHCGEPRALNELESGCGAILALCTSRAKMDSIHAQRPGLPKITCVNHSAQRLVTSRPGIVPSSLGGDASVAGVECKPRLYHLPPAAYDRRQETRLERLRLERLRPLRPPAMAWDSGGVPRK